MKKTFLFLSLTAGLLASCIKPVGDDEYVHQRIITLYFRDSSTNNGLIGRNGQPFLPDSVTVSDIAQNPALNYPSGYAQDIDGTGKWGVRFVYYHETSKNPSDDLTPAVFDKQYLIRFNAADTDTVRFEKAAGADVRLSWNGHFIGELPRNVRDTSAVILK